MFGIYMAPFQEVRALLPGPQTLHGRTLWLPACRLAPARPPCRRSLNAPQHEYWYPPGTAAFPCVGLTTTSRCYPLPPVPISQILFLDSDCMPLMDPSALFEAPEYREHGSLFFPGAASPSRHGRTASSSRRRAQHAKRSAPQSQPLPTTHLAVTHTPTPTRPHFHADRWSTPPRDEAHQLYKHFGLHNPWDPSDKQAWPPQTDSAQFLLNRCPCCFGGALQDQEQAPAARRLGCRHVQLQLIEHWATQHAACVCLSDRQ